MKRILFVLILFLFSFNYVHAQKEGDLSISPKVIDDSAAPRAMLEYSIKLKNNTKHKLSIFPLLEDLEKDQKKNIEGLLERQYKMTEWMSIKRGALSINSGEEISLPLKIDVSHDAVPDDYFVSITFAHGAHRLEAEENAVKMSPPKLFVNLVVEDQTIEKLSILKYFSDKKIFIKPKATLNLELNNSGNVNLIPVGNVFLYNKRGEELDAIDINPGLKTVPAASVSNFEIKGNNNLGTGRYKARLEMEYGNIIVRDIQDTVYIVVITLPFLVFFGVGILLFIILLSTLIFKKTYHRHPHDNPQGQIQKISVKKENKNAEVINLKSK